MKDKIKVIILTGPTGVGKTKISIDIAKKYNGEIISSDSMQIYKRMDIGTAKIKPDEMDGIKHHLIDILEPTKDFSASEYQIMALNKIKDIHSRKKLPIIVGGTGLYIDSIIYDMNFSSTKKNVKRRKELEEILFTSGNDKLLEILFNLNPNNLGNIDLKNPRRVIRAIEVLENHEIKKDFKKDLIKRNELNSQIIILNRDREDLYKNIDKRVDNMIAENLINEVRMLKEEGLDSGYQSMKAIGYRQVLEYLDGTINLSDTVELIKRDSRRYAKRQLTWFKKYEGSTMINIQNMLYNKILEEIYSLI
ncbi:MAG: tRNA (adenosine(37)-N6)-dimethylallyltransferase MiaA [Filifactoraceae bacterium]